MEEINRDNGCLAVVPGTHQEELLEHSYPDWEVWSVQPKQLVFWCNTYSAGNSAVPHVFFVCFFLLLLLSSSMLVL